MNMIGLFPNVYCVGDMYWVVKEKKYKHENILPRNIQMFHQKKCNSSKSRLKCDLLAFDNTLFSVEIIEYDFYL
jgi:hypothetical protein